MSCAKASQLPFRHCLGVGFWGRSNVGKSSLLNSLIGKNKARVSKQPGRTQLVNIFECNDPLLYCYDLPGYGYAVMPGEQADKLSAFLPEFFVHERSPDILCWLIDIRHGLLKTDLDVLPLLHEYPGSVMIVTTKNDKLSKQQQLKAQAALKKQLEEEGIEADMIHTSSLNNTGIDSLEKFLLAQIKSFGKN